MGSELQRHPRNGGYVRSQVDAGNLGTSRNRQARSGLTGPPEPHDEYAPAVQYHRCQRSFRVESATSANTTLMIQKRTMILGSDQPSFS